MPIDLVNTVKSVVSGRERIEMWVVRKNIIKQTSYLKHVHFADMSSLATIGMCEVYVARWSR